MGYLGRVLAAVRYLVVIGVVASLALSVALFVLFAVRAGAIVVEAFGDVGVIAANTAASEKALKRIVVACIEAVDVSLLATALYIVALGLYELFIAPAPLPDWLVITTLDDLKGKLINVIVVILGVSFLGQVVTWDGSPDLLAFGVAIAAVVLALSAFGALRFGKAASHGADDAGNDDGER